MTTQDLNRVPDETSSEQVSFGTHEAGALAGNNAPVDRTYRAADVSSDLGEFLSRPTKIQEYGWDIGTPFLEQFTPWSDFLADAAIVRKTANFLAVRGDLHVKFQISGSPFFSGRMMVSYYPLAVFDGQIAETVGGEYALIRESQRITAYIDPTTNEGCHITCPFYYIGNAFRIAGLEAATMGEVTMREMATLRSVSESSTRVNIAVYAWMTNVSFVGQTFDNAGPLATIRQMAEGDEPGPVSKVASAVADAASALSSVPGIGPYAKATSIAARTGATIARNLGYSRPTDLDGPCRFVGFDSPPTAVTNEKMPLFKLAMDARNEISIDPNVAGFPSMDELDIQHLVEQESYLTQCTWQLSDAPGAVLFNSKITPHMFDVDVGNGGAIHFTPMGYLANLFKYWRGPLEFRFQVCTSSFHKGKLKVSFDALAAPSLEVGQVDSFNTAENFVVDITESREFTVRVNWAQKIPYGRLDVFPLVGTIPFSANSMNPLDNDEDYNGMLTLSVINPLTSSFAASPSDAQIDINVFVKAGPNFTLAVPKNNNLTRAALTTIAPTPAPPNVTETEVLQSTKKKKRISTMRHGYSPVDVDNTGPTTIDHTFAESIEVDESNLIFYGEAVRSCRAMLKRFTNYATIVRDGTPEEYHRIWVNSYPYPRGFNDDVIPWKSLTWVNYIGAMFLARRGGIRYVFSQDRKIRKPLTVSVDHTNVTTLEYPREITVSVPNDDFDGAKALLQQVSSGTPGQQILNGDLNAVEIPYYSRLRFLPSKAFDTNDQDRALMSMAFRAAQAEPFRCVLSVAGAEDLTYHGFMGVPIVYTQEPI